MFLLKIPLTAQNYPKNMSSNLLQIKMLNGECLCVYVIKLSKDNLLLGSVPNGENKLQPYVYKKAIGLFNFLIALGSML
jgi:hypothetical protein